MRMSHKRKKGVEHREVQECAADGGTENKPACLFPDADSTSLCAAVRKHSDNLVATNPRHLGCCGVECPCKHQNRAVQFPKH
eukprot:CAMPEP_0171593902 /NCGR_PEP_ID=MMETSP0990-20121206/382_1 /TAXON_ID=483369 /ORGANISM="non described non described, Strain CCMP2098" /LENGTH=81 /DNA_ID=CAMNT_0012154513 /DNA_START=245 /DNA_END=491 /DNA_ORIENTATION=+